MSKKDSRPLIPFNRPAITGREEAYLSEVMSRGKFAGGGPFSKRCNTWLKERFQVPGALVTTSCTHALEMAALLCELEPGDEVIAPSFGFSSTATAFVRCGARMVFVDVEPSTMNIDPAAVAAAVTDRTRVIVALHYAGVPCDMDSLASIAEDHDLQIVEDAAQAIFSEYKGRPCGTLGDFGCFSFHETKNVHCGEGGAILFNEGRHLDRAEIILEKGTDRARFFRGEVDKYTWRDIGSSYVLSELNSAFLLAQLEHGAATTRDRLETWASYHTLLAPMAEQGWIEIASLPEDCRHNGHIFWIKSRDLEERSALIQYLAALSIQSVFHYVPLHSTPAGERFGRFAGEDRTTTQDSERLLRLPLFYGLRETLKVSQAVASFYGSRQRMHGSETSDSPDG